MCSYNEDGDIRNVCVYKDLLFVCVVGEEFFSVLLLILNSHGSEDQVEVMQASFSYSGSWLLLVPNVSRLIVEKALHFSHHLFSLWKIDDGKSEVPSLLY